VTDTDASLMDGQAPPRPELHARRGHRRGVGVGGFIHVIHSLRHSRRCLQKIIRCIPRSLIFARWNENGSWFFMLHPWHFIIQNVNY